VNLNKGRLGDSANLLGALLVSKIKMAAFSRTDIPQTDRQPFYLYIDEFQNFATNSFIEILSEARKYKLSLILAHQNLSQLSDDLRDSILANCGIQACFRVNRPDAQLLARELMGPIYRHVPGWELNIQFLQEVPPRCCYVANKPENGIVGIRTLPVPSPWEFMSYADNQWDEETFNSLIREIGIGAGYTRSREEIERECIERASGLMAGEEEEDFKHHKSDAEA
jgi:Type IV secretory pathway, VirD4 components